MKSKLAVVGGSTPFTAALVDAIEARVEAIPPHALMLNGQDPESLDIVARYASNRLSKLNWSIDWTIDMRRAVRGSRIVLHQARYGGSEGRRFDEEVALACGIVPDETLGPAALQCALRISPMLESTCRVLVEACPNAWVLNLTNPLSITTARMMRAGVKRTVGLCELPRVTVRTAAAILGQDPLQADWDYTGLNHRGFIVALNWEGRDYIRDLPARLRNTTLDGVRADEIASLGAIPTKYFRLLRGDVTNPQEGRAMFLSELRKRILEELRADPTQSPPSLRQRYHAWYSESVVPFIEALSNAKPTLLEINAMTRRGIVEEGRTLVSAEGIGPMTSPEKPAAIDPWLARFINHEQHLLEAVANPSHSAIADTLAADPLVPSSSVADCAARICRNLGYAVSA